MKPILFAFLLFTACKQAPKSDDAETSAAKEVGTGAADEAWAVDAGQSKVEWIGTKVSGYHTGTINIESGVINVNDGVVTGGKFTLNMKSIAVVGPEGSNDDANNKLLGHLQTSDFFDVEKYPTAVFEITAVNPFSGTVNDPDDPRQETINKYKVTDPTHTVSGNLTLRGVTKNIEFPAKITVNGNDAEALAKFNIDRTQWDIVYPGKPDDLIRKDIHIGLQIKASKASS